MKEIASVHNPAVQFLRELQKPRARRESGLFLAESVKMVREAVALGLCRTLVVEAARSGEYAQLIDDVQAQGCEVLLVTPAIMQAISEQKTPQGIACTVQIRPEPQALDGERLIALDGVQDPGNVGTILRTADAAGFDGALLGAGCADLYGPKTLRATMGSVFRVPTMRTDDLAGALEAMKQRGYAIVATELGGEDFYAHCPHRRCVLVIGSEGRGISQQVRAAATHHLALPMRGGAESLNAAVAAGIMIYEIARER
ncbi:MAG: RNA methyltransferase [Clostridia bacterium]|nr:RNA methyltransferase [Clostridia bacterium]